MYALEFYRSRSPLRAQRHRWRVRAENGNIVAQSSEGYANREECERMARAVLRPKITG